MPERAAIVYDCLFPLDVGGGERVYRRMAELLVERGVRTDYITRRRWTGEAPEAPFGIVAVWDGDIYRPDGVRRTSAAIAFALHVFTHLLRRRRSYDIVIASALPVLTALAVRSALFGSRTRVIADWLEIWPAGKWRSYAGAAGGTFAAALQWIAARTIREHTVNSRFTAERLKAIRSSARPVVLGLVDLVEEGVVAEPAEPAEILFVGRLIADKRPAAVPSALAAIRHTRPDATAVIVGSGPERDAVAEAATASGVADAVDLRGRVDDTELATLRSRATVLLAPSIREGFGLAVAESAASGVPVVVVRHPDNAAVDLVEVGVNGFISETDAPEDLAAEVLRAIDGGDALRRSTRDWFERARRDHGLAGSIDAILRGPAG